MRVLIVGAGGHAQVVADILMCMQAQNASVEPVGYVDENPALTGKRLLGLPVLGVQAQLSEIAHDAVIIAIGDNQTRKRLFETLVNLDERFVTACHPSATIAPDVRIGLGCMICAGVVVNPGVVVGANVILNTGCTIDHHNHISDHVHVAPGAHLGGEVTIGEGALVGIGATVMPGRSVGAWSVVGAGACITKSVPAGLTVVGIPAKPWRRA